MPASPRALHSSIQQLPLSLIFAYRPKSHLSITFPIIIPIPLTVYTISPETSQTELVDSFANILYSFSCNAVTLFYKVTLLFIHLRLGFLYCHLPSDNLPTTYLWSFQGVFNSYFVIQKRAFFSIPYLSISFIL